MKLYRLTFAIVIFTALLETLADLKKLVIVPVGGNF